MTSFSEAVTERTSDLLEKVRKHPLLAMIAEDRISDDRFRFILGQNFLFRREHERFISSLIARTPMEIRRPFVEAMMDFYWGNDLAEEIVRKAGIDLAAQRMSFPCHSFVNFLFTAVAVQTFPEAISVGLGAAESAREFWTQVHRIQPARFSWSDLVETWTGDAAKEWIAAIANAVDSIAASMPPRVQERMLESYRRAVHYQIRFLDMALEGNDS